MTFTILLNLGATITVQECSRVGVETANWLGVSHRFVTIGMDANRQPYAGLVLERSEDTTDATVIAHNLINRFAAELPETAQHVRQISVSWRETHSGINILGLSERTYELRATY